MRELEVLRPGRAGRQRIRHGTFVIAPIDHHRERIADSHVVHRAGERGYVAFVDGGGHRHVGKRRHGVEYPGHVSLGIGRARVVVAYGDGQEIEIDGRGGRIIVRVLVVQREIGRARRKRVRMDSRAVAEVDIDEEGVQRAGISNRPGNLEVTAFDRSQGHAHTAQHRIDVVHNHRCRIATGQRIIIRHRSADRVGIGRRIAGVIVQVLVGKRKRLSLQCRRAVAVRLDVVWRIRISPVDIQRERVQRTGITDRPSERGDSVLVDSRHRVQGKHRFDIPNRHGNTTADARRSVDEHSPTLSGRPILVARTVADKGMIRSRRYIVLIGGMSSARSSEQAAAEHDGVPARGQLNRQIAGVIIRCRLDVDHGGTDYVRRGKIRRIGEVRGAVQSNNRSKHVVLTVVEIAADLLRLDRGRDFESHGNELI